MINKTFFPTPVRLARDMAYKIRPEARYILEPSAGAGSLLDAIRSRFGMDKDGARRWSQNNHDLYAIEQDQDLVATLRGKSYNVVAFDFLTYEPSNFFDAILMNPPFDNGDEHLLHAIDILRAGEIVCLLNKETLANPYTARRKLLVSHLEALGAEITDLGQAFAQADRKTGVEVVQVYIDKKAKAVDGFEYWAEVTKEATPESLAGMGSELVRHDQIEALVASFGEVQKEMLEGFRHIQRAYYFARGILNPEEESVEESIKAIRNLDDPRGAYYMAANGFMDQFRRDSWKTVFNRTGADKLMSRAVRDKFATDLEKGSNIDFTAENIRGVVGNLIEDAGKIIRESILDVFEHLCKFDAKNKIHVEGWKTNSAYKVNRKVIIPYAVKLDWGWSLQYGYDGRQILDDLDRCLRHLSGKREEEIVSIASALEAKFGILNRARQGKGSMDDDVSLTAESTFFELRFYMKGTLHLKWKDENLWLRFNREAARGKNWLGDDAKADDEYTKRLRIGNVA